MRDDDGTPLEPGREVTSILSDWRSGDRDAANRLAPLVYEELRRLAASQMRSERSDHTLQPTALVHEAYARLVDTDIPWRDRGHFFATAARMMRRILVDHARGKGRQRRGGSATHLPLDEKRDGVPAESRELLALDDALTALAEQDPRKAQAVELRFFAGLSHAELAQAMDLSEATVDRDLRVAKAWLKREMSGS